MISFDSNVLIYATAALADDRVSRAQDLLARALRTTTSILLLQSLAEFSNVAIRKARIPANAIKRTIEAWLAVLPVQSADDSDRVLAPRRCTPIVCRFGMQCCGRQLSVLA